MLADLLTCFVELQDVDAWRQRWFFAVTIPIPGWPASIAGAERNRAHFAAATRATEQNAGIWARAIKELESTGGYGTIEVHVVDQPRRRIAALIVWSGGSHQSTHRLSSA